MFPCHHEAYCELLSFCCEHLKGQVGVPHPCQTCQSPPKAVKQAHFASGCPQEPTCFHSEKFQFSSVSLSPAFWAKCRTQRSLPRAVVRSLEHRRRAGHASCSPNVDCNGKRELVTEDGHVRSGRQALLWCARWGTEARVSRSWRYTTARSSPRSGYLRPEAHVSQPCSRGDLHYIPPAQNWEWHALGLVSLVSFPCCSFLWQRAVLVHVQVQRLQEYAATSCCLCLYAVVTVHSDATHSKVKCWLVTLLSHLDPRPTTDHSSSDDTSSSCSMATCGPGPVFFVYEAEYRTIARPMAPIQSSLVASSVAHIK